MTKPKAKQLAVEKSISTFPPKIAPVIKKPAKRPVTRTKPDGWFTPKWPPGFVSQLKVDRNGHLQALARANRAVAQETGKGWGNGTIVMAGTPKTKTPGWM